MTKTLDTGPPFRAEHIGSLLRPTDLTRGFRKHQAGEITDDEFRLVQDDAIRDVIRLQESIGLEVVTDGEFRRASYWAHWVESVNGLDFAPALFKFHDDRGNEQDFIAADCVGKLEKAAPISTEAFKFLDGATNKTIKVTMPSPSTLHFWRLGKTIEGSGYVSDEDYMTDLLAIYRQEMSDLASLGCSYVQFDEVPLIMLANDEIRNLVHASGSDPRRLIELYVQSINQIVNQRPENMTIGMHICRGNFKGKWLTEGGYGEMAEQVFEHVDVDVFCLEFDSERAGGFEPLRFVPEGKKVVLGLVSSKVSDPEDPDVLKARIDEAAEYVPLENLSISPQCGFASTVSGNPVTLENEISKLQLVVNVAEEVWGEKRN
ncbi:MAG: 5-methyltetrahydropteroyltriglutamate--homocysteine S-methyltransferase [Rhodothermia bacterium]|nr:MAG: 5-methyltetrahydropteroyltriglutamate--homocysteine S-methyltransferase [Rhodothermia bacterium]